MNWNRRASRTFDKYFVPNSWKIDGLQDYVHEVVPPLIQNDSRICDVGGGKRPFVGLEVPKQKGHHIIGIDIDKTELDAAPQGVYDKVIVSDIGATILPPEVTKKAVKADLIICEAVLEHVADNAQAVRNIAGLADDGGKIALFIPSRNALFAIVNRYLPEKLKRAILFTIFPETAHAQGFPAFYDHCTPREMRRLFEANGVRVDTLKCYYFSTYFSFFLPAHMFWRLFQLISYVFLRENAAESFSIVGTKDKTEPH